MKKHSKRQISRVGRHMRVRKKINGTMQRPRLCVFRTNQHIYVQAIDDVSGVTLASASTVEKNLATDLNGHKGNKSAAQVVGKAIAERLKEKAIESVVFDRGGFVFHGRVKALAESAREAGLQF